MIPQTNPKASYLAHREAIDAAIKRTLDSGWFILGQEVKAFEQEFAAWVGCTQGIGVASGTDAIELAVRASGVQAGDFVFTVSHTANGTVVAIERAGAIPVFVDIDPATYTMDPNSLDEAIKKVRNRKSSGGGRPAAVVPVHLYGQPADLTAIMDIAKRNDLLLIEDCAQCHGAEINGRRVGTLGIASPFSFYPTKNLGAIGDGGAVVTSDAGVADRLRMLREYGWKQRYVSDVWGFNSRLDEIQAAILRAKLPGLNADNAKRQAIAARYSKALANCGLTLPVIRRGCTHMFHQYVVRTPAREELREHLKQQGVGTLVHYPMPVHAQPAYRERVPLVVPLPHTEQAAREVLSLPMYPELLDDQVESVIRSALDWASQPAGGR